MKVLGITQARIGSTRLKGKVLMEAFGKTMLSYHLENALRAKSVDSWILATTTEAGSEKLVELALNYGILTFRGDTNNVLNRFYEASKFIEPEFIVRVTSDCPLLDPKLIDDIVNYTISNGLDYCSTAETFPDGVDVEVFKFVELIDAHNNAVLKSDLEHVTPYIRRKENNSKSRNKFNCNGEFNNFRLTVDEMEDYNAVCQLIENIGANCDWIDYVNYIKANPTLFKNQSILRNEGYNKSLENDNR